MFTDYGSPLIGIKGTTESLVDDEKIANFISAISNLNKENNEENKPQLQSIRLKKATYIFCKINNYILAMAFGPSTDAENKNQLFLDFLEKMSVEGNDLEQMLINMIINVQKSFPPEMICKIDIGEELSDEVLQNIYYQLEMLMNS